MKILWRTLIILLAAAVVTGATLGAMQMPAVQTWIQSQGGGHGGPPGMAGGEFAGRPEMAEATGAETAAAADAAGSEDAAVASAPVLAASDDEAAAATGAGTRPMRGEGGGHNSGGNLQGLVEVAKNFGIVVAASLAIAAVGWAGKRLRPHRRAAAAAV